ncbi:unnamed protein product [Triticum aestivum]|uniref:Uncharacterized protein n=1 Tax=Triticum aestivum TaxID=4565 RepID=A0A7H4LNG6_WHEAT|nr:unnamed protein product [Triticum aestivum]
MAAAEESKGEGKMTEAEERERERKRSYPDPSDPFIEVKFDNDFVDIPSNADESPAWSLLVGVKSGVLRVHRFRVARSGRISDRSDNDIQVFHDLKQPQGCSSGASAVLAPDGRSLCLLQRVDNAQTEALQLQLPAEEELSAEVALPPLDPSMRGRCMPISADGHIWAVSATYSSCTSYTILLHRLVIQDEDQRWEQVGIPLVQLCKFEPYRPSFWGLDFLQGYAVLPHHGPGGGTLILLSLQNGLFFTFNCSAPDAGWTKVTQTSDDKSYVPILGRGVYAQESNAIYMLRKDAIYAYKLGYEEGSLKMDPPVDIIFPYVDRSAAHGLLTHLGCGVMCSVLIDVGLPCRTDHLHAVISTFRLGPDPSHVKLLHSTSRQVDMLLPMEDIDDFELCFLQEYKDDKVLPPQVHQEGVLHDRCRHLLPPGPPSPYVKPHMDNELLFIICQTGSKSFIYKTTLTDLSPDIKIAPPLKPHYIVQGDRYGDDDGERHFFRSSSKLYAVSFQKDGVHELNLDTRFQIFDHLAWRPVSASYVDPFVMVIQVGSATLALTETLQVYQRTHLVRPIGSTSWVRCRTNRSQVLDMKVKLSGYVAVGEDSFIVCDTVTCSCLQFDLRAKQWHLVMPWAPWGKYLPRDMHTSRLLNGRCIFVDGFIYTSTRNGLAAYELLREDHCVYLGHPISLPFSWETDMWRYERMCLDYAGKDVNSGAILFWVVQGLQIKHRDHQNTLWITAVEVETEKTPRKIMKPVGIRHVVSVTRLIDQEETMDQKEVISTRCCALSF